MPIVCRFMFLSMSKLFQRSYYSKCPFLLLSVWLKHFDVVILVLLDILCFEDITRKIGPLHWLSDQCLKNMFSFFSIQAIAISCSFPDTKYSRYILIYHFYKEVKKENKQVKTKTRMDTISRSQPARLIRQCS